MSSVQIIFKGRQNLKRIFKAQSVYKPRHSVMGSCLPLAGGDVVDEGVLVEVGGTGVLLGRVVDWPGKGMAFFEKRGVIGRSVQVCLSSSISPLPSSPLLTHPGELIINYSTSLHSICSCVLYLTTRTAPSWLWLCFVKAHFEEGSYQRA